MKQDKVLVSTMTTQTTLLAPDEIHAPRERVIRWLQHGIEQGLLRRGATLPSERVIAKQLNVSRDTVRAALNDFGASGLVESDENGRRRRIAVDRPMCEGLMSHVIAILSETPQPLGLVSPTIESVYFKSVAAAAVEAAGMHALGLSADRMDSAALQRLSQDPPRGVMVVEDSDVLGRILDVLQAMPPSVPVVARTWSAQETIPGVCFDRVVSDHAGGSELLTRWLAAKGRRQILRLWQTDTPAARWICGRNAGYERAVKDLGLEMLDPLVVPLVKCDQPQATGQLSRMRARFLAGYLADYVLGERRIDAIMLLTDAHAYQVAAALRILKLEPNRDVVLVGYDNHVTHMPGMREDPASPIATIDKRTTEAAQMMVELLEQRIRGELPPEPQVRVCPHQLIDLSV